MKLSNKAYAEKSKKKVPVKYSNGNGFGKHPRTEAKFFELREESPVYGTNGNGSHKKLTCVDLFAGCGGLSLGLEEAGFTPQLFSEINPDAAETYIANRTDMQIIPVAYNHIIPHGS